MEAKEGLLYVRNIKKDLSKIMNNGYKVRNVSRLNIVLSRPRSWIKADDGYFNPKPFFQLCKDLVVHNLHLVDSLKGFPEQIGEDLFLSASFLGSFNYSTNKRSIENLQLFAEVYDNVILTQLFSSGMKHLLVDQHWIHLKILLGPCLTKLDISDCNLGDDHEIFKCFQQLTNLTFLNVANNSLTFYAIQLLTMSVRFSQKGPSKLKHLNLSGNFFMTKEVLPFLIKPFKNLQRLDLSRTLIEVTKRSFIWQLFHMTDSSLGVYVVLVAHFCNLQRNDCSMFVHNGFSIVNDSTDTDYSKPFETLGWAKNLISLWEESFASSQLSNALKFYGSSRKPILRNIFRDNKMSKLILIRISTDCSNASKIKCETNESKDLNSRDTSYYDEEVLLNYV